MHSCLGNERPDWMKANGGEENGYSHIGAKAFSIFRSCENIAVLFRNTFL